MSMPDGQSVEAGWIELHCRESGLGGFGGGDSIRALALDPLQEVVWTATASGMIHAHSTGGLTRVVSTFAGSSSLDAPYLRSLAVNSTSVIAAVPRGLGLLTRGGVPCGNIHAESIGNPAALALNPLDDKMVAVGGQSRMLAVVDCAREHILRQAPLSCSAGVTAADWVAPPGLPSVAVFATQTGRISLCDPSSMREMQSAAAFAGAVTSISCSGYYLAATGSTTHGGVAYMEQAIKIFDMRRLNTPLPSVPFAAGPAIAVFDPWTTVNLCGPESDALWGLSADGVMQCVDASQVPSIPVSPELHLDCGEDTFTCMKITREGIIVLGDSGGFLHEWSSTHNGQMNAESKDLFLESLGSAPQRPTRPLNLDRLLKMDAEVKAGDVALSSRLFKHMDHIPAMQKKAETGMNRRHGETTSYTQPGESIFVRRPWSRTPLIISPNIIASSTQDSFLLCAQAPPGFVRNSTHGHEPFPRIIKSATDLNAPHKPKSKSSPGSTSSTGENDTDNLSDVILDLHLPSVRSTYVEMDLVAYESIEGFDFLKYNRSGLFCGLENALPNVYVNSVIQSLYFTPPLRHVLLKHTSDAETGISWELGCLFNMIDLGSAGMACEAGNFTKAFSAMANADALGLLDGKTALPPFQRIEDFTRYLLEQLHKDDAGQPGTETSISQLFGGDILSYGRFSPSGTEWSRESRLFQHTLAYSVGGRGTVDSFCGLLANSLSQNLEPTRAFCEKTGTFEMMSQKRILKSLPNVLLFGCGTKNPKFVEWWCGEERNVRATKHVSAQSIRSPPSPAEREAVAQTAMAREGKLLESIRVLTGADDVTVLDASAESDEVYGFDRLDGDGYHPSADPRSALEATYDLAYVIAYVPPTEEESISASRGSGTAGNVHGHLISYTRVPAKDKEKGGKKGNIDVTEEVRNAKWWCFNDFVIAPCESFQEVQAFDTQWKVPCLLGYVKRDIAKYIRMDDGDAKVSWDVRQVIGQSPESGQENAAFGLAETEEEPTAGTLFALDCEFVLTARDEAEIWGDGTRRVMKPSTMALGRVSVVRACGNRKGTPIIDDYVHVKEPIIDYLTRFSGLTAGDLDRTRSPHVVRSLKSVYNRLRCLVAIGCVFIGHGLKKDFRIINFVVPSRQVIDTVTLFHLPNRRLLGLRYLTATLLRSAIQMNTHDSVEDAVAAMQIYEVYLKVHGDGSDQVCVARFHKLLLALYSYGYKHKWKPSELDPFVFDYTKDPNPAPFVKAGPKGARPE